MGLLTDYVHRKWRQSDQAAIAEGAEGLLGTPGWEQMGPFQEGSEEGLMVERTGRGPMIGGTGLLGGEGMMDPENRARYATGLMALPGMQDQGTAMLSQQFGDQQAMQQFMMQQAMQNQRRVGPYENESQYQTTLNPIASAYEKAISPYRTTLEKYTQTADLIRQKGGIANMTGADDMVMLRNFIKMTVPNEAVMSDDQRAAQLAANGYPGQAAAFLNMLKGEGSLDTEGRETLFQTMGALGNAAMPQYQGVRNLYQGRAQRGGLDAQDFMRPQVQMPGAMVGQQGPPPQGEVDRQTPPGVPFEFKESPTGWATYDEDGNIIVYDLE